MHRRQDGIRDFISPGVPNIKPETSIAVFTEIHSLETVKILGVRKTGVDAYQNICYNKE